jgi:hypothetical protein
MAVRKDINCVRNTSVRHSNGELIGVLLKNVNGRPISGVSCYSAHSWGLNSYQVVEADL